MATFLLSVRNAGPKEQITVTPGLEGDALAAAEQVKTGYAWRSTFEALKHEVSVPLSDFVDLHNEREQG